MILREMTTSYMDLILALEIEMRRQNQGGFNLLNKDILIRNSVQVIYFKFLWEKYRMKVNVII